MDSAEFVLLMQKVGAAAMMNMPEIPVPDLDNLLDQMGDNMSNLENYFRSLKDPAFVNIYAFERGLHEISVRYFCAHSTKAILNEVTNIFHGFSRKNPLPVPLVQRPLRPVPPPTTSAPREPESVNVESDHRADEAHRFVVQADVHPLPRRPNNSISREEWLRQREFAYDAVDELRRLNDEAAQLEESDIIPEDPQINMTNREIDFQQMRLEDNFPMPLAMDAIDNFGEENEIEPVPVLPDAATENGPREHPVGLRPDVQPENQPSEQPTDNVFPQRKPRRRIRRIADLDPNYRPPRSVRPAPIRDASWSLSAVNEIRQGLAQLDEQRMVLTADSADRNQVRSVSGQQDRECLVPPTSENAEIMPLPLDDSILPNDDNMTSLPRQSVSLPQTPDQPVDEPCRSKHSTPVDQSAPGLQLTPLVSPVMMPAIKLSNHGPLPTIIEVSDTSLHMSRSEHHGVMIIEDITTSHNIIDRPSDARAPLMPDIEHGTPCVLRSPEISVSIANTKKPIQVQIPSEPANLLIKPMYEEIIKLSTELTSYWQASSKIVDGEASLDAKDLLQPTNVGHSEVTAANAFLAYCNMHNKKYVTVQTIDTPSGSVFSSVTPVNPSDAAESD